MNAKIFKDEIEIKGVFHSYLEELIGDLDSLRQHSPGSRFFCASEQARLLLLARCTL